MSDNEYKSLWWKANVKKYGSEEAVRKMMSEAAKKRKTKTGFTTETAKEAAKKSWKDRKQ